MLIRFTCPKCRATHEVAPPSTGTMVACPTCGQTLAVKVPGQPRPGPAPAPRPSAPRADDVPILASVAAEGHRPKKKKKRRDEDDYEEEGSNKNLLIIGGVAGGVVAVGALVVLIIFLASGDKAGDKVAARNPVALPDAQPRLGPGPANRGQPGLKDGFAPSPDEEELRRKREAAAQAGGGAATPEAPAQDPAPAAVTKPESPPPDSPAFLGGLGGGGSGATAEEVHQYVLKSIVWIVNLDAQEQASGLTRVRVRTGSGSLVDKANRLVLTNFHVVEGSSHLLVLFPAWKDGKLLTEREAYMNHVKNKSSHAISGKVVALEESKDLALIQLERVPSGFEALPMSRATVGAGQNVHSVGSPGTSPALWSYTPGTVRGVTSGFKWQAGPQGELHCHADVVVTTSPTNPGDSGGPLVNDRGELVGVTHGFHPEANSMSIFIEVNEARKFIEKHLQSKNIKWVSDARPPLRGGRRFAGNLSDYIKALSDKDATVRQKAAAALGEMGPDAKLAISSLMKLLKDPDDLTRRLTAEALNQIGPPDRGDVNLLSGALKDPSTEVRAYAAQALGKLGNDAGSALPELLNAAQDRELSVRVNVLRALGGMGSGERGKVAPVLTKVMNDDTNREMRVAAGEALTALMRPEVSDVPELIKIVKHKDADARVFGIRTLAKLGKDAKEAIADLTEAAKGGDSAVRREAILALARMMPEAKTALPVLTDGLKDPDKQMRLSTAQAIGQIGAEARPAVPLLVDMAKDTDKDLRLAALTALSRIGREARAAAPALAEALRDSDDDVRDAAIEAAGALASNGGPCVTNLLGLLDRKFDPRDQASIAFRNKVAKALGRIGKPAIPALIRALDESNPYVVWGACVALGEIGPAANNTQVIRGLTLVSQSLSSPEIREDADRALRKIRAGK